MFWAAARASSTELLPARAPENCWPTAVPMAWNSGMATNWIPTYGTGFTVGWAGSAELLVAQATNFFAAATFCEPAGTASDQAQSQLAFFPRPVFGARAKPTLSATFESFGLVTKEAATVASIHMPHLPALKSARFSLKPFEEAPGGPASRISLT